MKVIVAGATAWDNREAIRRELSLLPAGAIVITGDSPGADALGEEVAGELKLQTQPMQKNSADYERYKRGAWKGLNERMLASGAELVLAFHPAVEKSSGTRHLVNLAGEAGVEVKIFTE